jgi:hypothetical protein
MYRVHNACMQASAWRLVFASLRELEAAGLENDTVRQQLKNSTSIRSRYLAVYDLVNVLVNANQQKFSVLATSTRTWRFLVPSFLLRSSTSSKPITRLISKRWELKIRKWYFNGKSSRTRADRLWTQLSSSSVFLEHRIRDSCSVSCFTTPSRNLPKMPSDFRRHCGMPLVICRCVFSMFYVEATSLTTALGRGRAAGIVGRPLVGSRRRGFEERTSGCT